MGWFLQAFRWGAHALEVVAEQEFGATREKSPVVDPQCAGTAPTPDGLTAVSQAFKAAGQGTHSQS